MKDDLGLFGGHDLVDLRALADVPQEGNPHQRRELFAQLRLDRVERKLAIVEQHQPARRKGRDLPTELGPDRAAGAGDEHAASRYQPRHPVTVEHRLRAAEQIFERDWLDRPLGTIEVALEVGQLGQAGERDGQRVSPVEQLPDLGSGEVLCGDDQLLRASAAPVEALDHRFELLDRAKHRHTIDLAPDPRGRVRQHADHAIDGARVTNHLADEGVGAVLGADQQHRHARVFGAFENVVETAILEQPISETRRAQ